MPRQTLSAYLRDYRSEGQKKKEPGPYLTISFQQGCDGYELGKTIAEKLNARPQQEKLWKVFYKEFLEQLSEDTGVSVDQLEQEYYSKPSIIKDFLKGMTRRQMPDRIEIRNQLALMMRLVAIEGYAIIISQGSAAATGAIANGLKIRIEAPLDWRVARLCRQGNMNREQAKEQILEFESQQLRIRKYYAHDHPRQPEFHLVFDNSHFTKDQIAEMAIFAMEQKQMIPKHTPLIK